MFSLYRIGIHRCLRANHLIIGSLLCCVLACRSGTWNDPYPESYARKNIVFSSFSERPKHLDPALSYVVNESEIIAQIYEPPLQYHYLHRPYRLVPLAAAHLPEVVYLDAARRPIAADAPASTVAFSVYDITIQPGIRYQPHPAFALDGERYLYHQLSTAELRSIRTIADFKRTGTRELVAEDYVYQLKRMAHPQLHSPIAGLMSQYIVGLREYGDTLARAAKQEESTRWFDLRRYTHPGVQVLDRYRYRITLRGKYPQFRYWLAMPFFAPLPWEADRFYSQRGLNEKNISLDWYPVGTGPFMLVENDPNRRMTLVRNPHFRGERYPEGGEPTDRAQGLLRDAGKRMPFIDKAIYSLEKESIPYWSKFLQGYYDTSAITSDAFDQAIQFGANGELMLSEAMRKKDIQLVTEVTTSIWFWGFNMLDSVVGGKSERARKLRQALSIAIDPEEFISIFLNGRGIPAQGPIPPGIFGYRDDRAGMNPYVYEWQGHRPKRRSLSDARQLLKEAGYVDGRDLESGKPLVLYFDTATSGPDGKSQLDWIRKQFAKLDISLILRTSDFNRFQDKVRKGTWQILFWGWSADYPDAENFLFLLYGPNAKVAHGGENHANYQNSAYDRLFEQMKDMENGPARQQLIDRMVDIIRRDAPWIWGFHPKGFTLHHAWYHNVKPNLMANNTLKYKRIDGRLRSEQQHRWNRPVLWPLGVLGLLGLASLIPAAIGYRRRERSTAR